MKFGSVCSGIEAASVAWNKLGWTASWLAEIEPFPSAVLAHHYPDVPNLGDMTLLPDKILSGEVEAPDIFCGGTPCQAFSIAGNRESLDDARGNLSLTFCEIANAIDSVRTVPSIIFWENVPGVLNTKDNAFGCFLAGLAGEDGELKPAGKKWTNAGCVFGPKRAVAWRVLDAQYFGLAQRRKRVFVVASARDGFNPAEVLFEFDGLRRDTAPSRNSRETTATDAQSGIGSGSNPETVTTSFTPSSFAQYSEGVGTLRANGGDLGGGSESIVTTYNKQRIGEYSTEDVASTCAARDYKDATDLVINTIPLNTMTILGRPSDDLKPRMGSGIGLETDPSPTITKAHSHAVAYGITENFKTVYEMHAQDARVQNVGDVLPTMSATYGSGGGNIPVTYGIQSTVIGRKPENGPQGSGYSEDISFTQTKTDVHAVAYNITFCDANGTRKDRPDGGLYVNETEVSNALTNAGVGTNVLHTSAYSFDSLSSNSMKSSNPHSGCNEVDLSKTLDTSCLNPACNQGGVALTHAFKIRGGCEGGGKGYLGQDEQAFTISTHQDQQIFQATAFAQNQSDEVRLGDVFNTLTTNSSPSARNTPMLLQEPVTFKDLSDCLTSAYGTKWNGNASADNGSMFALHPSPEFEVAGTMLSRQTSGGWSNSIDHAAAGYMQVTHTMAVRRLTPTECERLQGFPDGYTQIPWRKKPAVDCPDGPRYKALGNSWAVPVVAWIGGRINEQIKNKS